MCIVSYRLAGVRAERCKTSSSSLGFLLKHLVILAYLTSHSQNNRRYRLPEENIHTIRWIHLHQRRLPFPLQHSPRIELPRRPQHTIFLIFSKSLTWSW
ncbi:hypothetical protein PM082_014426 [Marasmius tenuissimus]|nr:hypothetical protein PM082_014426 [Marasmius tenuissimus]